MICFIIVLIFLNECLSLNGNSGITGGGCCGKKIENRFYHNDNLGMIINRGIKSYKNCIHICNAFNNPGPKVCHGLSFNKKLIHCFFYISVKTTANITLPCSKDDKKLVVDETYDYYCQSGFKNACLSMKNHKSLYYNGSCFVERKNGMTFDQAKKSCTDMSPKYPKGHLAHTRNEEIFDLFEKTFTYGVINIHYYVGFAQKDKKNEPRGHWYWIDSDGNFTESADETIKSLWNINQPDNHHGKEDCGDYQYSVGSSTQLRKRKLNDFYCDQKIAFICEYNEHGYQS